MADLLTYRSWSKMVNVVLMAPNVYAFWWNDGLLTDDSHKSTISCVKGEYSWDEREIVPWVIKECWETCAVLCDFFLVKHPPTYAHKHDVGPQACTEQPYKRLLAEVGPFFWITDLCNVPYTKHISPYPPVIQYSPIGWQLYTRVETWWGIHLLFIPPRIKTERGIREG